jgi:hypothetical protein
MRPFFFVCARAEWPCIDIYICSTTFTHSCCVSLGDMNQGQELEVVVDFSVGITPNLIRGKG